MTRHLVKKQVAAARCKLLASKGRKNRKQLELVSKSDREAPEDLSNDENEVEIVDTVENKGGRSPRRAALEAAKKIYCCARNIAPTNDDGGKTSKTKTKRNPAGKPLKPKSIKLVYDLDPQVEVNVVENDLILECEDDMLNEAQTKLIKQQQKQHNLAMLKIRDANLANERFFKALIDFFHHDK